MDCLKFQVSGHKVKLNITNSNNKAPEFLNVFVILHSHVDPGWLKTFNNYYYHKVLLDISITKKDSFLINPLLEFGTLGPQSCEKN